MIKPHRTDSGIEVYDDGKVRAELQVGPGGACILEFSSLEPGKGNTRQALRNLRQHYGVLTAQDIGYPGGFSYGYWMKMAGEGLLDELYDDDLQRVFPRSV